MKKFYISFCLALAAASAMATITGDGYYRVQNYGSGRWASLIDNIGNIDMVAGSADVHALQLWSNTDSTLIDPASIVYITSEGGKKYNVAAQGTSIEDLIGYPVNLGEEGITDDGQTIYNIYGTKSGVTKYIGDAEIRVSKEYGIATSEPSTAPAYRKFRQWLIYPVNIETFNYFGAEPQVTAKGKSYTTMYASFGYQPYSSGVKAYYVGRVGWGLAEMIEITGPVPPGTPVIIECAGSSSADNKFQLITNKPSAITSNALSGVYFDYHNEGRSNFIEYNPNTMRVLGKCSDGSLGFVVNNKITSIPANSAYLTVEPGSPAEFKLMDSATFTADVETVGADNNSLSYSYGTVYSETSTQISVMNMSGRTVANGYGKSLNVSNLAKGIYIATANGKSLKFVVN